MHPVLLDVLGIRLGTHEVFTALGLLVAVVVFRAEARRRHVVDSRLWAVVAVGLAWGAVFMYAGTWLQHVDPRENAGLVEQFVLGNRSIIGGLVGAYLGVLLGKRLTGFSSRTGALFAPAVAAGLGCGRVGCLLTENPGTPTGQGWGIVLSDEAAAATGAVAGVPLHPSFAYEIVFHAVAFAALVRWRDRLAEPADLFTVYVAAYALFRFAVEFVRGNEVVWLGLTRPQLVLAVLAPLVVWRAVIAMRESRGSPVLAGVS